MRNLMYLQSILFSLYSIECLFDSKLFLIYLMKLKSAMALFNDMFNHHKYGI